MCKFFSLVSDPKLDKIMYFDWPLREKVLKGELQQYESDSHTSIADYFGYKSKKEDILNKYEYNPLTKEFVVDQLNSDDDTKKVKGFCLNLDFKTIVPQLLIKPIVHPFEIESPKITKEHLKLLKNWASVRDSVGSVRDSVWYSVGSVRDSVWYSVRDLVWSVWYSVWDSVWAYTGSFFTLPRWHYIKHKKGQYPFQSCVDLWEQGIVPSYDGKIWRLHTRNGIVWEGVI